MRTITRALGLFVALTVLAPLVARADVSYERLLRAGSEPQNWLTYSGSYTSQRHSALREIKPSNAANLELKWVFQAQSLESFETTPLVVDGVMYLTEAPDTAVALDPATGRIFWRYQHNPAASARPCCGRVNRGLAILGERALHGDDRRQADRARRDDGPTRLAEVGRRSRGRLCDDPRAAHREEQGDRRRGRRRIWDPRLHRGVRRGDRRGGMALLHDPGAGRAGRG